MRVLRSALAGKWPRRQSCASCRSSLEIHLADLRYAVWKVSGYYFAETAKEEPKFTFVCPICGCEANGNEVPTADIPIEVQQRLKSAYVERVQR